MSIGLYINNKVQSVDTKIDKLVTRSGISVDNVSVEDTILIHPIAINAAIPRNISIEVISKVYEENFEELRMLSLAGEEVLGGVSIKANTDFKKNRLNILNKSIKFYRQEGSDGFFSEENIEDYVWEYDCMNAFMHIIPFNFTLDKEPKPIGAKSGKNMDRRGLSDEFIRKSCILPKPLRVQTLDISKEKDSSSISMFYHPRGNFYLNATVKNEYRHRELMKTDRVLKRLAKSYNRRYQHLGEGLDFTKLVYGVYLSSIFLKMPNEEAKRLKESMDCISTVVSEYILSQSKVRRAFINLDSIVTKEPWDDEFTYDLYRVKHKHAHHEDRNTIESYSNTYRVNKLKTYIGENSSPSILGWYSADIENILKYNPGWNAYHIDIHAAYVNLAKSLANISITKDESGELKSSHPYLYQEICDIIVKRSKHLASFYGDDQQLLYWQTDGGLCLIRDTISVDRMIEENSDVVIEKVVGRTVHVLPEDLDISFLKHKKISRNRIFAYTLFIGESKKESTLIDYYANNFKLYRDLIADKNNIKGLGELDKRGLIKTISEFRKET
jgi:hypothetical protein